jgi:hypothetical protein
MAPVGCVSKISVNKFCYNEPDIIVIELENCNPQEDDWVGIWLNDQDPDDLGSDFITWAWTCGTQLCFGSPGSNRFGFEARGLGFDRFRAYLVRDGNSQAPYQSLAQSESFSINPQVCD